MKRVCAWALMCSVVLCGEGLAYKQRTHTIIAGHAAQRSVLEDPESNILKALDLGTAVDDRAKLLPSTSRYSLRLTPMRLMQRGADDEDLGKRSLRHFYDPQREEQDKGLRYDIGVVEFRFDASTVWTLESANEPDQEFSYVDAKSLLLDAVTAPTRDARERSLGRTFEALGHVIHHIQDMAQPQHVRNDIHCDEALTQLFESSWVAFPVCPLVGAYRPSAYEEFTNLRTTAIPLTGYDQVDYGTFDLPEKFWDGEGAGIAAFTSRNFVSIGSNFFEHAGFMLTDPEYPKPRGVLQSARQITDPDLLGPQGPNQPLLGEILFVTTPVVDGYRGASATNMRASTYSVFDKELKESGAPQVFTLNRLNYAAANDFLLPRATAYSTGLINYFFRGRIEIGLPADGVYGVVDHATTYAAGQGFGKLKLKLRNASPDGVKPSGERVPQSMEGGTLVAIAKYTLNSCYTPDLTGDFGAALDTGGLIYPANCTLDQYFAGEEQIAQSAAILGATLTATAAEFTFNFDSQPIPINARDLRIQVVYTGQLGAEADGIAFGGRDISEPTHVVVYNNSDYYAVDGKFYTPEQIRSDATLTQKTQGQVIDPRAIRDVSFAFAPGRFVAGPSTQPVNANGYLRVAVLADSEQPFDVSVRLRFDGGSLATSTFPGIFPAVTELRGEPAYITPFGIWRGARVHMIDVAYRANNAVPLADDALSTMSTRDVSDPGPTQIPVGF